MMVQLAGQIRRYANCILDISSPLVFPLLAVAALAVLLLLARHISTEPTLFGRWSLRYASLLAYQSVITISLAVMCIPTVQTRLLRRSSWKGSHRRAWLMMIAGLLPLPVLWLLLRQIFLPHRDPVLALLTSLMLISVVALVTIIMWRNGAASLTVYPAPPRDCHCSCRRCWRVRRCWPCIFPVRCRH